ncbi:hypothetical protein V8E36_004096 [Tilletia maclaganii]
MLDTIFVVRHGFRMNWHGNITLGVLGRPRDPVLTAHGLDQCKDLATFFASTLPQDQRPQLILASPYYRTVQTALPTAQALGQPIHLEPGLSEWFPPVEPNPNDIPNTRGVHPYPPTRALLEPQFPKDTLAPTSAWPPVLYPSVNGEDVNELHDRARLLLRRIERQCEILFPDVKRVLLVSHAATIIAIGRVLVHRGPGPPWEAGTTEAAGYDVGAGTASVSQYDRYPRKRRRRIGELDAESAFEHTLNGSCAHLSAGVEREWNFGHLPHNVTERGMGDDWDDDQAPSAAELEQQRTHWDEQERILASEAGESSGRANSTPSSSAAAPERIDSASTQSATSSADKTRL